MDKHLTGRQTLLVGDRRFRRTLSVAVSLVTLAACSSSHPAASPYAAQIRAAQREATSPFERSVLSKGVITAKEYDQAENLYLSCVRSFGYKAYLNDPTNSGIFQLNIATSKADTVGLPASVNEACRKGTVALIEPLYVEMLTNPDDVNVNMLTAACLRRSGLAPNNYTTADYTRESSEDGSSQYPFSTSDPRFAECLTNPSKK